jgi:hypothetical protein
VAQDAPRARVFAIGRSIVAIRGSIFAIRGSKFAIRDVISAITESIFAIDIRHKKRIAAISKDVTPTLIGF